MNCREAILEVARVLSRQREDQTFTDAQIVTAMQDRRSRFLNDTILYHVRVVMCVNGVGKDAGKYRDLTRVVKNRYRLL